MADDDAWWMPGMNWKHWGLVLLLVALSFPTSIGALIGTSIGAVLFVYILLILWSGMAHYHRGAVKDVS